MNNKDKNIFLEKMRFINGQGGSVFISLVITVTFLLWGIKDYIQDSYLYGWYFFMITITSLRLLIIDKIIHRAVITGDILLWKRVYYSLLFITGVGWGYIAWMAFPEIPLHSQTFMGLIFIAVLGSVLNRYSIMPIIIFIYGAPFVMPYTFRAFMQGNEYTNLLGLIMVAYSIVMVAYASQVKSSATQAIIDSEDLKEEIALRIKAEERLRLVASTDDLTNINNRRFFYELANAELERASRYNKPYSLMMLDIDQFKKVNDQYGHSAGDKTLIHFVKICQQQLRQSDIIGRVGGDEFSILLPETNEKSAKEIAERILVAISESLIDEKISSYFITTSIGGISVAMSDNQNLDKQGLDKQDLGILMNKADELLYLAKAQGRNKAIFKNLH